MDISHRLNGKYVESSGIVDVLFQSEALAQGSTNGVIEKHFNRCKPLHALLSAAFQTLHRYNIIFIRI